MAFSRTTWFVLNTAWVSLLPYAWSWTAPQCCFAGVAPVVQRGSGTVDTGSKRSLTTQSQTSWPDRSPEPDWDCQGTWNSKMKPNKDIKSGKQRPQKKHCSALKFSQHQPVIMVVSLYSKQTKILLLGWQSSFRQTSLTVMGLVILFSTFFKFYSCLVNCTDCFCV